MGHPPSPRRRRQLGQELVEFALVSPVFILLMLGGFDLMRVVQVSNTAADAARQGARQAVAAAVAADQPFGSSNGQACSGTTATSSATGTGCLTDGRVGATVQTVLGSTVTSSTVSSATPGACPAPQPGTASICVSPSQATRSAEWTNLAQQGSFLVTVTVVVRYAPLTPVVGTIFPPVFLLKSSTSMVAEY